MIEGEPGLLRKVRASLDELSYLLGAEGCREDILLAMASLDRAQFMPATERQLAEADRPASIGFGQTISQPTIVALMTHAIEPRKADRVLEIGTGSGYQAAVLAQLVSEVYGIERIDELARSAAARLQDLGFENVTVRSGDGRQGWLEAAPFDKIIVTAAADRVPPELVKQLSAGGIMVIPVGPEFGVQQLLRIEKSASGEITRRPLLDVRFVPLKRD